MSFSRALCAFACAACLSFPALAQTATSPVTHEQFQELLRSILEQFLRKIVYDMLL